jgi:uncharacterized OsmC-like protein
MTTATQTATSPAKKPAPLPRNGVEVPTLFETINAVRGQRELAKFQFRASNRWINGTHSRSRMEAFSGAGGEHRHVRNYEFDADHPAVLVGADEGPTPIEFLLHALASCLTAGIANIAAARGVTLDEVESTVTGDIDLSGLLGLDSEVRNGYSGIQVSFKVRGDASAEKLAEIVEQSRSRSAVFDVITNQVPVRIEVQAG